jgi:hypothetical protein
MYVKYPGSTPNKSARLEVRQLPVRQCVHCAVLGCVLAGDCRVQLRWPMSTHVCLLMDTEGKWCKRCAQSCMRMGGKASTAAHASAWIRWIDMPQVLRASALVSKVLSRATVLHCTFPRTCLRDTMRCWSLLACQPGTESSWIVACRSLSLLHRVVTTPSQHHGRSEQCIARAGCAGDSRRDLAGVNTRVGGF